ncbi:hypothetical protein D3H55_20035 [Bacillus salacetis]|uniref:Uncharacterized protein n=1 Tax=Bacillus salacetis TaxID=2315464 RepID=A0A3A1QUH3_9BACI|nr:hypothetical protein D3H55_20035 [Bacillus salacetis]
MNGGPLFHITYYLNAVFVYIVAFGKIPGAGFFPLNSKVSLSKKNEQLFSFLLIRGLTAIYQDII